MLDTELDRLRRVVEDLAGVPRLPTSPGERHAAGYVREALRRLGYEADVEEVPAISSYAWPIGLLSAGAALAGLAAGRGRRAVGVVGGALAAAAIADHVSGGSRPFRRLFLPKRTAYNTVGYGGSAIGDRTVVVFAHHDAAPSGVVFDQTVMRAIATHRPQWLARAKSNPPLWWPVIAGPALVAAGSALGVPGLRRAGIGAALATCATMADIGRRPAVPGANDNLTGVAAMLAVARRLRDRPVERLRVLFLSAGAEEALQEGIRGFAERHFPRLARDRTWFINLETLGSGHLVLLEGEGPVRMRDYEPTFKDLVAKEAAALGIPLERGLRLRTSTDSQVPNRHGYPVATLVSIDEQRQVPHYHLDTDLPEHVDFGCVGRAVTLAEAVIRALDAAA
jgi:hypothetical protein